MDSHMSDAEEENEIILPTLRNEDRTVLNPHQEANDITDEEESDSVNDSAESDKGDIDIKGKCGFN